MNIIFYSRVLYENYMRRLGCSKRINIKHIIESGFVIGTVLW